VYLIYILKKEDALETLIWIENSYFKCFLLVLSAPILLLPIEPARLTYRYDIVINWGDITESE
jgi:hypothetical protein